MRLKKEDAIFLRDGEGNLIPQEVVLEKVKGQPTILAIPFVQGDLEYLNSFKDNPAEYRNASKKLIQKCCVDPKFTDQELDDMTAFHSAAITVAILSITSKKSQAELSEKKAEGDFLSLKPKPETGV
jgi:hypothetical protein